MYLVEAVLAVPGEVRIGEQQAARRTRCLAAEGPAIAADVRLARIGKGEGGRRQAFADRFRRRRGQEARPVAHRGDEGVARLDRSEEHTSELQSLMPTTYAVFCSQQKHTQPQTVHIIN